MSSLLAHRVAWLGLVVIGLRLVAWRSLGGGGSVLPPPADLPLPLPAASPGRGGLEARFSSTPADTSSPENTASHENILKKKLDSVDAEINKRRKKKPGRTQKTGSGSDSGSNQAVAAPLFTATPTFRQFIAAGDIVEAFGGDYIDPSGSSVASVASRAGLGGARGDGDGNTAGGSEAGAGFCAEERRQHKAQWAHARENFYVDFAVVANQRADTGLPPLWPSSSVATGPDFECEDLMSAEQKSSGVKVARPSWGACALQCGDGACTRARQECRAMPKQCRGVALMSDAKYKGLGVLKGDYVWTAVASAAQRSKHKAGPPSQPPSAEGAVKECMDLYAATRTGNGRPADGARQAWLTLGCGDYSRPHWEVAALQQARADALRKDRTALRTSATSATAAAARRAAAPAAEWGGLPEATRVASRACRACPTETLSGSERDHSGGGRGGGGSGDRSSHRSSRRRGDGESGGAGHLGPIHVVVVTDRPGASLCAFLRTALWAQLDVTVLSWAPNSPPRWLEWYLGSKPLVVADYLGRCLANRQRGGGALGGISANATVLVTDADVLFNAASSGDLAAALAPFARRLAAGEVIFSAEGPCVTVNVAYRKQLCAAFIRRASDALKGAQPVGLTALNSGLLVGQAWAMRRLARRFVFAAKQYQSAVLQPTAYAALQARMRAAMAAADSVTNAVDNAEPAWAQAAAAAAAFARARSPPQPSSPVWPLTSLAAAALAGGRNANASVPAAAVATGAGAAAGVLAASAGGDTDDEDGDGDDLSRLMRVRARYRRDLVSGSLTKAAAQAGRLMSGGNGGSSSAGLPFLFNDQSVYYLMLSVESFDVINGGGHGVTLDYQSALFLSMYGTPNRLALEIDRRPEQRRLVVLGAQKDHAGLPRTHRATFRANQRPTAPLFVHFNGGAKLAKWNPEVSRAALHDTLLLAHRARTNAARSTSSGSSGSGENELFQGPLSGEEVSELDVLFARHVAVVDNHWRRVEGLAYSDICPRYPHSEKNG